MSKVKYMGIVEVPDHKYEVKFSEKIRKTSCSDQESRLYCFKIFILCIIRNIVTLLAECMPSFFWLFCFHVLKLTKYFSSRSRICLPMLTHCNFFIGLCDMNFGITLYDFGLFFYGSIPHLCFNTRIFV